MAITTAIYPGTFDPITKGHESIIKKAANLFDNLIIGVAKDTNKTTKLNFSERVGLISSIYSNASKIKVFGFEKLLVDFMHEQKISVIIRGLRSAEDFIYEQQIAQTNHLLNPNIQTIFLTTSTDKSFISSSMVHEVARLNGNIDNLVSKEVANKLYSIYGAKNN